MADTVHTKVLIIGSGPAGYTAAIYAARANLEPVQVLGLQPGGQLTITTDVENYPGYADVVQGPWLMEQMKAQAEAVGAKTVHDLITDVNLDSFPYVATADSGAIYKADTIIIATGAKARWLGLESEEAFRNLGVSACATCDGFFFRGKKVAVVGGGNSAVEEALFLANLCEKVTLIHRRDELRAEKIMQERLFAHEKIDILWDHVLVDVLGDKPGESETPGVHSIQVENVKTKDQKTLELDGVFIAIGHDPATELFRGKLDMDEEGYLLTAPDSTATSIEGVFAAGDVKDKTYRQAVTAAGMGCMAALEADKFLGQLESKQPNEAEAAE